MQDLNNYITERLKLTSKISQYSCQPKDKFELRDILEERLTKDKNADLNDIDVSQITDMGWKGFIEDKGLFEGLDPHNIDISEWDVSNVKTMDSMFFNCRHFNCDLSNWNVSNVEDMNYMFWSCKNFNCDISKWNVSNVANMKNMFDDCEKFNCDLNKWDVSNVKEMMHMFNGCTSLKNIPLWWYK